ncbi:MAG: hypothetical protein HYZ50_20265 [Deltaproteobacteria bacterium]|nr:hypothetical protein [Deltaproteobacteria bacterium]
MAVRIIAQTEDTYLLCPQSDVHGEAWVLIAQEDRIAGEAHIVTSPLSHCFQCAWVPNFQQVQLALEDCFDPEVLEEEWTLPRPLLHPPLNPMSLRKGVMPRF